MDEILLGLQQSKRILVKPYDQALKDLEQEGAKDENSKIFLVENEQTGTGKQGNRKKGRPILLNETLETIFEEGKLRKKCLLPKE